MSIFFFSFIVLFSFFLNTFSPCSILLLCFFHFFWVYFFSQFPINPDYEFDNSPWVPYLAAYTTNEERNNAVSQEKSALSIVWNTNIVFYRWRNLSWRRRRLNMIQHKLTRTFSMWLSYYVLFSCHTTIPGGYLYHLHMSSTTCVFLWGGGRQPYLYEIMDYVVVPYVHILDYYLPNI